MPQPCVNTLRDYLPGMRIGGGLSKWGPALLSTLIVSSKTPQSIWNSKGLQKTLTMLTSTSMLTRMLRTLVFFSMLLPASNSLKCFSCYSKDSCYTENILIKVGGCWSPYIARKALNKQINRLAPMNGIVKEAHDCYWHSTHLQHWRYLSRPPAMICKEKQSRI